jgi:hypothetical protein
MENVNPDQITHYIKDLDYPARKKEIIDKATRNEANPKLIDALKKLADDQVFESPMEISRAVAEAQR